MAEANAARALTTEERSLVSEEEFLHARVRQALAEARRGRVGEDEEAWRTLRDAYAEAGEEDRPGLLAQMHEAQARLNRSRPGRVPDMVYSYLGHLRVTVGGRTRDILLGDTSFVDTKNDITIVEWRKAPIAEVFFTTEPGDEYEIQVEGRTIEGKLEAKRLVELGDEGVQSITISTGTARKMGGEWVFEPGEYALPLLAPGVDPRKIEHAGLLVKLDAQQQSLVDRDEKEPLLVLGSAGSGKTTVALFRLVAIHKRNPAQFPVETMLVLVPEPGLRRLSERTLESLGIFGVRVSTFDDWVRSEARRVFPWLPHRESPDPPYVVSRMKRHPGMIDAITDCVQEQALQNARRIDRVFGLDGFLERQLNKQKSGSLVGRFLGVEKAIRKEISPEKRVLVLEAWREERKKLPAVREDLKRLVGDSALLGRVVERSEGELNVLHVPVVTAHTRRQLEEPAEQQFAHVDADRMATLDGLSLDAGTPEAVAGTVDVEDYAILFELLFQKTGTSGTRSRTLSQYSHIVLDEAQELAPIELRLVGRAIREGGSVTVAGDAAQRMDRTGHFRSWEVALDALGIVEKKITSLETSYRSPRPTVELGHFVLGEQAPSKMPTIVREGAPVLRTIVPSEGHGAAILNEGLRRLRAEDPLASIAVITRDEASARRYHEAISRGVSARFVSERDGDFRFGPGIEVTSESAIRGLEFDYVVVPDMTLAAYPDTQESRRALHVVVTRAMQRVWLLAVANRRGQRASPIAGF